MRMFMFPLLILLFYAFLFSQTCPVYTHKDDVIIGERESLPSGWIAYHQMGSYGVKISSLSAFDSSTVPNTEEDYPTLIDISDDGQWILYLHNWRNQDYAAYIIRKDGRGKTLLPISFSTKGAKTIGFVRESPKGNEIFWTSEMHEFSAIQYMVTGDTIMLGAQRKLTDFWRGQPDGTNWEAKILGYKYAIWRDQIFGLLTLPLGRQFLTVHPKIQSSGFITIPDNGEGVATVEDIYQWTQDPRQSVFGCGHAMSWDGTLCLANSNSIGNACIPNTNQTPEMDHKGFYITPFRRLGDSTIDIHDHINSLGTSINWCPSQYRQGTYQEVDFNKYNFSNDNEYVVCIQRGSWTEFAKSLWVVHWPTNTWTRVNDTSSTLWFEDPAMYIESSSSILPKMQGSGQFVQKHVAFIVPNNRVLTIPGTVHRVEFYSLEGRLVHTWIRSRNSTDRTAVQISFPANMVSVPLLVQMY